MTAPDHEQAERIARKALDYPHHHRCDSQKGGECDCYKSKRDRYLIADAYLALAAQLAERERALRDIYGFAREIERSTQPGDAHECAKHVQRIAGGLIPLRSDGEERPRCDYCGDLGWTVERYGRITHKESCPYRTDPWSQSAPRRSGVHRSDSEERG